MGTNGNAIKMAAVSNMAAKYWGIVHIMIIA